MKFKAAACGQGELSFGFEVPAAGHSTPARDSHSLKIEIKRHLV